MRHPSLWVVWAWVLGVLLLVAGPARAEGTPRDVVEVEHPEGLVLGPLPSDFTRIDHGWLTLELPASVEDRAPGLVKDADAIRSRLTERFAHPVLEHVLVRVARDADQMLALAPNGLPPPRYASGVAYGPLHLAILALQAPGTWEASDLTELIRHELTHLALHDAVLAHHTPRWFDEGLAIHESDELPWKRRETLWYAALARTLPPLSEIDEGFPIQNNEVNIAYAESADVVRFLMRDADRSRFGTLIEKLRQGTSFDRSIEDAYGEPLRHIEYEWREDLTHRVSVVPLLTGGGALWGLMSVLVVVAWVKRRKAAKEKLAQWAKEEAEMDAAAARARERAVLASQPPQQDDIPPASVPGIPVVEHEGRWYTVH
jgi:hypothetical protein